MADKQAFRADLAADLATHAAVRQGPDGLEHRGRRGGRRVLRDLPISNWRLGSYKEGAKRLAAQSYHPRWRVAHHTCQFCRSAAARSYASRAAARRPVRPRPRVRDHGRVRLEPAHRRSAVGHSRQHPVQSPRPGHHVDRLVRRLRLRVLREGAAGRVRPARPVTALGDGPAMLELVRRSRCATARRRRSWARARGAPRRRSAGGARRSPVEVKGLEWHFTTRGPTSRWRRTTPRVAGGDHSTR